MNYWRDPKSGWRRRIDFLFANFGSGSTLREMLVALQDRLSLALVVRVVDKAAAGAQGRPLHEATKARLPWRRGATNRELRAMEDPFSYRC